MAENSSNTFLWDVLKAILLALIQDGHTDDEIHRKVDFFLSAAHAGEDIEPEDGVSDDDKNSNS